jgi:hypothetical protein
VLLVLTLARWVRKPLAGIGAPAVAFSVVTLVVVAVTHLAWYFDWGGAQTGSSTAGLAFLVIPFWSAGLGALSFMITLLAPTFKASRGA